MEWTDVLTAIGTVAAAVIALGIALWTELRKAWKQPRLSLDLSAKPGASNDLTTANSLVQRGSFSGTAPSVWVRARVSASRSTAHDAEVLVQSAWIEAGGKFERRDFGSLSLTWSGDLGKEGETKASLPRGVARHIDIAWLLQHASFDGLMLAAANRPSNGSHIFKSGTITLDLALASANGPASYYRIVLAYDGGWKAGVDPWALLRVIGTEKLSKLPGPDPSRARA